MAIAAGVLTDIESKARTLLRDFARPHTTQVVSLGVDAHRYRLESPNVVTASLVVTADPNGTPATVGSGEITLDSRYGTLQITATGAPAGILLECNYTAYSWVSDDDLAVYRELALASYEASETEEGLEALLDNGAYVNLMARATIVETLWSLLTEFSFDINVDTPEQAIPASQRFSQVQNLLRYWEDEEKKMAAQLEVGIHSVKVGMLRRTSHITNRLVPVYLPREYDDYTDADRVYPVIDVPIKEAESW